MNLVAYAFVAGLFGLAVGSFLNVVIYRVPAGVSVVRPPSACPACGHSIRNRHNVPVLGWLMLRGRCYDCQAPIGARYPAVEATTGLLFAGITAWFGHAGQPELIPAFLYLAALCLVAAMIAQDGHPLPTSVAGPSYAVVFALLVLAAAFEPNWWGLGRAAIATVGMGIVGLLLPRGEASVTHDAREIAQLAVAPLAFLSWWTLGYATAGVLLASAVWTGLRGGGRNVATFFVVGIAALAAVLLPVP